MNVGRLVLQLYSRVLLWSYHEFNFSQFALYNVFKCGLRWASCWSSVWKDVTKHLGWSVQCTQMLWIIIYHILELHTWTKCLISKFCYTSSLIYEYIIKVLYRNLITSIIRSVCYTKVVLEFGTVELQKFEWKASSNSLDTYVGPIPARLQ